MLFLIQIGHDWPWPLITAELDALLTLGGLVPREVYDHPVGQKVEDDPFLVLDLPGREAAVALAGRCTAIVDMLELWTLHDCRSLHDAVASLAALPPAVLSGLRDVPWRMNVHSYRAKLSRDEQAVVREHFALVSPCRGPVKLGEGEAVVSLSIICEYQDDLVAMREAAATASAAAGKPPPHRRPTLPPASTLPPIDPATQLRPGVCARLASTICGGAAAAPSPPAFLADAAPAAAAAAAESVVDPGLAAKRARRGSATGALRPPGPSSRVLVRVFVGRDVGPLSRPLLTELALTKRRFLGPTSLDPQLGTIMANLAQVTKASLVYDPFVGTGSLLVSAAKLTGCFVMGSDIDVRIIRPPDGRSMRDNFVQYGLGRPELLLLDTSCVGSTRIAGLFDAIITDPPYGVRAGARRSGVPADKLRAIPDGMRDDHIARTQVYQEGDLMFDLLDRAARELRLGGRLVYLMPSVPDHTSAHLPVHPCLVLESDSEQPLSLMLSRRIVCMRKVAEYEAESRAAYAAANTAAAAAAGILGVSIKERMGAAYDSWFARHHDAEGDAMELYEKVYGSASASRVVLAPPAGGAGGAGGAAVAAAAATAANERDTRNMSLKETALHRRRLIRQMMRAGEVGLTRKAGGAGLSDSSAAVHGAHAADGSDGEEGATSVASPTTAAAAPPPPPPPTDPPAEA